VRSRFFRRFAVGTPMVAVAAGESLILGGAANAAPPAGTLGNLTFIPASGSDTQIIIAHTPVPCDEASSAAKMDVTGPVGATNPVFPPNNPYAIATSDSNSWSNTDPFDIPEANHLKAAADSQGKVLAAGEYDFTVTCTNLDTGQASGTFTGAIFFTDPTHYNTGDAPGPSPSPSTSPSPSASPSPSPTDPPTLTPTATPDSTTPSTSTSDAAGATTSSDPPVGTQAVASSGTLANTGAPIALAFLGGVILLAVGLALAVWMKRPKKAASGDGGGTSER
jgi:hypothetical protein